MQGLPSERRMHPGIKLDELKKACPADGGTDGYVSISMSNARWKFGVVQNGWVFLAPAMTPQIYSLFFEGISNAEVILQELNRMQLVLERMTRNIVANIRKERLANEIKDIANKHNGNFSMMYSWFS